MKSVGNMHFGGKGKLFCLFLFFSLNTTILYKLTVLRCAKHRLISYVFLNVLVTI